MEAIFGKSEKIATPAPPPPPPTRADPDVQAAALAERRRLAARQGRSSTILTSGQGVVDEATPATRTLLGGV